MTAPATTALIVRRLIRAPAERLFDAWTDPVQLVAWWGPRPVTCVAAEVDLRVGGKYRIGNRLPDGSTLWIFGELERIERPSVLVYTWRMKEGEDLPERVTVRFEPKAEGTEVVIVHERIGDAAVRAGHEKGWEGCLDSLEAHAGRA